ncbi:hypothetical protein [Deinococcus puniceus]|uniref:DUF8082 domain-containing protein n=1 Tax=Deinococcus puniceus TaxID=1182568 RepID=A0A172T9Z2_9DEIO|nr:hypothetical protein [Deinococcus puniceus]ANE43756.1 hypothetical protein SU48_08205 [Deinococcus puniceus]
MTAPTGQPNPTGPLSWPNDLQDATPLPFNVWRVMHQVNGERDAMEVARLARVSLPEVLDAVTQAARWSGRAAQREQPVTEQAIKEIQQCLMVVVGPMGEFMVDDAFEDLGEDNVTLSQLLGHLATQLGESRVQAFVRQLRARGIA